MLARTAVLALVAAAALAGPVPTASSAACAPRGAIGEFWRSVGAERSFLGACTSDELGLPGGVVQRFTSGDVYWSSLTGARSVHGAIRATFDELGGPASGLGLPVTHELPTTGRRGAFNHFQGGSILWSPATGAAMLRGAIRAAWDRHGGHNGGLGFPVVSETPTAGVYGAFTHFEGGSLYWSPSAGARLVLGAVRAHWLSTGAEAGPLGLPVTDEQATSVKHGAVSHFAAGSVYWSPTAGAHALIGAIRERWWSMGAENSFLGFPVRDEYGVEGGARADFSGGSIEWDARTGGTTVIAGPEPAFAFTVSPVTAADLPASWREGCPVLPPDLRLLHLSYRGFDGAVRTGELVVNVDVTTSVLRAFDRLYTARFPIARMERVDVYGGSDAASMDADNTSAFNCRRVAGSTSWSEHAYGRALDINPVENPWVSGSSVSPPAGQAYRDRRDVRPGMIVAGNAVVAAFAAEGWGWGGSWSGTKDYQHLSRSGR